MKLVIVSDLHLDKETLGVPRAPEVEKCLWQAAEHAQRTKADAFVFLGDLADPDTGGASKKATACAIDIAMALRSWRIPSIWMAGNHDVEEDGTGATTLTPLVVLEEWTSGEIMAVEAPRLWVFDDARAIALLPFTAVARAYDPDVEVRKLLDAAGKRKTIVAGHLNIAGIGPGEETLEMPRGREVMFPIEATTRAAFRMCGHYHTRQNFDPGDGGAPIHIPGSPAAFAFGEHDGITPAFSVMTL